MTDRFPRLNQLVERCAAFVSSIEIRREEQRLVLTTVLCAAVALWLAIAWAEPEPLLALPILGLICWAVIRAQRRAHPKGEAEVEDWRF